MAILNEAAAALPQVFALLGKKATFTLRRYRKGITPTATTEATRARIVLGPPSIAQGYITAKSVYVVAASIGSVASLLEDDTIAWTVQKFDHSEELNVEGPFRQFAPGDDLIWVADLEGNVRNAPGGSRYSGL